MVKSMRFITTKGAMRLPFLFVVAACTATPDVTRINTDIQFVQEKNLTLVARMFRRDVQDTINFEFDKEVLSHDAMQNLDVQAEWILAAPDVRFSVYGHTDKVGSSEYNDDLGLRRAERVVAYFISKGINPDRLEAQITYGEDMPVIDTENAEVANRRATTFVSGPVKAVRTARSPDRRSNDTPPIVTPPAEKPPAGKPPAEKPPAGKPPAEKPPVEKPPAGKPPADTPPAEKPPVEKPPAGKPPADTPPADTPPAGPDAGKKDKDHVNAGRGNGPEDGGDPGNSGDHNNGGDID
jgi:outer membrane protein OmpA-like peptidoglycan-associated protein